MPADSRAGTPMKEPPPATAFRAPPMRAAMKRKRLVTKGSRRRNPSSSWKKNERVQQGESCAPEGVLGHRDVRLGIARATLRVNDLDVRGGSCAKADIHDVDDLVGLFGSLAFCDQHALGAGHRLARGPHFRRNVRRLAGNGC